MKYKNVSEETQMFKINDKWVNVLPEGIIDTPDGVVIKDNNMIRLDKTPLEEMLIPNAPVEAPEDDNEEELSVIGVNVLNKMTKDEINDYAAKRGWDTITTGWKKSKMIKEVLKKQDETE